jgi:Type IIA topoisomerase (DNA gyrase/topo II, topoisomerase IV), B subunit
MKRYIDSDEELDDILGQLPPSPKPVIQRYKGLVKWMLANYGKLRWIQISVVY